MEKNNVLVQKLMLIQPIECRQEQLDDDDIDFILRAKKQDAQPGWADISNQSRELKNLWSHWDSVNMNQETLYRAWESENGQNKYLRGYSGSNASTSLTREVVGIKTRLWSRLIACSVWN